MSLTNCRFYTLVHFSIMFKDLSAALCVLPTFIMWYILDCCKVRHKQKMCFFVGPPCTNAARPELNSTQLNWPRDLDGKTWPKKGKKATASAAIVPHRVRGVIGQPTVYVSVAVDRGSVLHAILANFSIAYVCLLISVNNTTQYTWTTNFSYFHSYRLFIPTTTKSCK